MSLDCSKVWLSATPQVFLEDILKAVENAKDTEFFHEVGAAFSFYKSNITQSYQTDEYKGHKKRI